MTVRGIAAELGLASSVYCHWETGKSPARKPNALAIQALFGYRWEWVMTGEGPKRVEGAAPSLHELEALAGGLNDLADKLTSAGRRLRVVANQVRGER